MFNALAYILSKILPVLNWFYSTILRTQNIGISHAASTAWT